MRAKIIAVFTVVVLVVGVLAFALTRASLGAGSPKLEAGRALVAADAVLRVQALEVERWLESQASDPKLREPFSAGTVQAKGDQATQAANGIKSAATKSGEVSALGPSLVLLVDAKGVAVGRDGSQLMRGDDLGAAYPALKVGLEKGVSGSDVWVTPARNEQMLVSWVPLRGEGGVVVGGVVLGTALSDGRLDNVASQSSGAALLFGVKTADGLRLVAKTSLATGEIASALEASPGRESALSVLASGQAVEIGVLPADFGVKAGPLGGYGDGRRAVLIAVSKASVPSATTILFPFLGAIAIGILLVAIGGHFLGQYYSGPVEEIEEGLLAIMNGRTDYRFEIEHAELGGLISRLNSLLNQLLNVQEEEETDAEGHPAHGAKADDFKEALAVDETLAEKETAGEEGKALRAQDDEAYYKRIFEDYIRAKKKVGDPVDHITREAFIGRIMASERQMSHKHGKPVRYKVEVRGKEVVLLAVPLA